MKRYRFLFSRRWAGYVAAAIVFATACHFLAQWQFARRADAVNEIATIDRNFSAQPKPLTALLPSPNQFSKQLRWSQVRLGGHYLPDQEVLVRNRPFNGSVGYEVITPFLDNSGRVFFVDRGWVAAGSRPNEPSPYSSPPTGELTIIARLLPGEPSLGRQSLANQIGSIDLNALAVRVASPSYTGAYGLLVTDGHPTNLQTATLPNRDEGPHLSYALQWYVFAIIGFGWLTYAARLEARSRGTPDLDRLALAVQKNSGTQLGIIQRPRRPRAGVDAEVEDTLLDG